MLSALRKIISVLLFLGSLYLMWSCAKYLIWQEGNLELKTLLLPFLLLFGAFVIVRILDERQQKG